MDERVVNCLYKIDGEQPKQKTLEIIKVMKGAISVSKSRTGEVIYRNNKFETESLKRQLKRFDKARTHLMDSYDSRKRTTLRRWALVFEKQKSMNESIKEFDSVLTQVLDGFEYVKGGSDCQKGNGTARGFPLHLRGVQGGAEESEEEEEEEDKEAKAKREEEATAAAAAEDLMTRRGIQRLRLQPIGVGKNSQIKVKTPEPEVEVVEVEKWPLENHKWINEYIQDQKSNHKNLITKNILKKIHLGLSKGDPLFRFQLRATLSENPWTSIDAIVSARSAKDDRTPRLVHTAPDKISTARIYTSEKRPYEPQVTKGVRLSSRKATSTTLPPIETLKRSKTMF